MWSDPLVTRYIGGKPSTKPQTWGRLLGYAGHWAFMGFGYWALEERSTGAFVGELGFADFKRDIDPAMPGIPELGWALCTHARGRGYATEAVAAALAWGDAHLASPRTFCIIDAENHASIRVAEKSGFTTFAQTTLNDRPVHLYARPRP